MRIAAMKLVPALALVMASGWQCVRDPAGISDVPLPDGMDVPWNPPDIPEGTCPPLEMQPLPSGGFIPGAGNRKSALFDPAVIHSLTIAFTPNDWDAFQAVRQDPKWTQGSTDEAWAEEKGDFYVPCTFTADGNVFNNAACRPRGSPEHFAREKKPQVRVRFDKWDGAGRFQGMRAINLEFNRYAVAPIRDRLAMEMMREAGVDAPLVAHANVTIQSEDRGVYMMIEPVDKEFVQDRYPDDRGNIYEGGYQKKNNKTEDAFCDIWALNDLVNGAPLDGNHSLFFEQLEMLMDVDQVLKVMAAEIVFPTRDNLANGSTNFVYYFHPGRGFLAIPWDLDGVFAESIPPDSDNLGLWGNPDGEAARLLELLWSDADYRKKIENYIVQVRDGPFQGLVDKTANVCSQIRDIVETDAAWLADNTRGIADFDEDCEFIKQFVTDRVAWLKSTMGR
jgi:hypothetical protein